MPSVELDVDVFEAIKKQALLWVDSSPSETLRRLLGLDAAQPSQSPGHAAERSERNTSRVGISNGQRGRQRKVDLGELQQAGLLEAGQTLYLRDYSGKLVAGAEATVGPANKVTVNSRRYSMSDLAARLLKKAGYAGNSVRGPAHWFTADGVSVLQLWQKWASSQERQSSTSAV